MDPITIAMKQFQEDFREFRDNPEARVLRIVMESKDVGSVQKILRGEEWAPENTSPFLIFDRAFMGEDETFEAMNRVVLEHYELLKKSFEKEGTPLPDFGHIALNSDPVVMFTHHIQRFAECTKKVLDPPFLCWLPTDIRNDLEFQKAAVRLIAMITVEELRFVFADEKQKEKLAEPLKDLKEKLVSIPFEIDEEGLLDYFKKMMAPPSKGRVPGTLSGVAAPDVEPPARPGPKPPSDEEVKTAVKKMGLPPVLTVTQAKQLRHLVFEAAVATGEGKEAVAIARQSAACELCASAGVKLEEALMTMVLANCYLHFGREKETEEHYHRADELAGNIGAYPQMAQIRLALGYLLLKNKKVDEAAHLYEQAAFAAIVGGSFLLYLEALRMAGTCHLQQNRDESAYLCWQAAVEKGREASADEIRVSSYLDIAGALINYLRGHGLTEQAKSVEAIVQEVGKKPTI